MIPKFDRLVAPFASMAILSDFIRSNREAWPHDGRVFDRVMILTTFADGVLSITANLTWSDLASLQIDHFITPSTFERCLSDTSIKDRQLRLQNGWIVDHPTKEISVYWTRLPQWSTNLCPGQWTQALLQKSTFGSVRPDVVIPPDLLRKVAHKDNRSQNNRSPGKSFCLRFEWDWFGYWCFRALSGWICFNGYEVDARSLPLQFERKTQWCLDLRFRLVAMFYLTGSFSGEMADHLSTLLVKSGYLWHASC